MRRFGLIGFPLEHSFSQKYFTQKFKLENIQNCYYELFPISAINELKDIILSHQDLEGFNVTIPYKKSVLKFLDDATNIPPEVQACNCVRIRKGKLIGYNTDIVGFEQSIKPLLKPNHSRALILGTGGSSSAVAYVLKKSGIEYVLVSREEKENCITYGEISAELMQSHQLIINTTPVGMYPHVKSVPPVPMDFLTRDHLCYDLIYNPERTLFLQQAESWGASIKNGAEMLKLQAEESWRIWNS